MTFESHLNETLNLLLGSQNSASVTAKQLIQCIDLTLLDENTSQDSLIQLKNSAEANQVAAICVYSKHLSEFQALAPIQLATVVNFPQGNEDLETSLNTIEAALQTGVNEIDYVLPYQLYLAGHEQEALDKCLAINKACQQYQLTLKIILETGAFPDFKSIYKLSISLIEQGCDFLKTSTGKISQGASLGAAFAILSAIKDSNQSCGIKISGGVKEHEQAINYAKLAELMLGEKIDKDWFRIGASSLLNELLK